MDRTMFKARIGDLFASHAHVHANAVNCAGIMGKGIAQAFKRRYPAMFEDYAVRCREGRVRIGEPYLYDDASGIRILNFPTKRHWRSPSRLEDIAAGLDYLAARLREWDVRSLALPPLGCGNGGLAWEEVGPLIYRTLAHLPVDIEVYAPYGTPLAQLETAFLTQPANASTEGAGKRTAPQPGWIAIMEVLRRLQARPEARPIGRTLFQTLCWAMTELGVPTGLTFRTAGRGPRQGDVRPILTDLANRNWLQEQPQGRTMALRASPQYDKEHARFAAAYAPYDTEIAKAVDLFAQIRSIDQAEDIMTVFQAARRLQVAHPGQRHDTQQLLAHLRDANTVAAPEEQRRTATTTIETLLALDWIRLH
ncbi:macro domain-containing protein [Xanthomonas sp. LF07-6]|uniref:macro domain-containing protein n=1 Tax=Xanthomonas sp. LF07-6 TaxID=3097550 RepID=UPI002A82900D|nr:macro domain-containing protein [Xanthomonas sp. LF07-6]MDY4340455.1 macro domain-containing protein [Xanthomonas sp. LF07-6]